MIAVKQYLVPECDCFRIQSWHIFDNSTYSDIQLWVGGSWKKAWRRQRPREKTTRWRHNREPPSTAALGANHQVRPQDVWVIGPSPPVHKFIQPLLLSFSTTSNVYVRTLWMPLWRAHWYSGQDRLRESSDLHAKKERSQRYCDIA